MAFCFSEKMKQKQMQFEIVGAIDNDDEELLNSLIKRGVNVDATVLLYLTPLTHALKLGRVNCACLLIQAGCDTNQPADSQQRLRPIHLAAILNHVTVLKVLIQHGVDINGQDGGQMTALHFAAHYGHIEFLEVLLDNGVDVTVMDDCGRTALHRALDKHFINVAKRLITHGINVDMQDKFGWTALFIAVINGYMDCVQFLISQNCSLTLTDRDGNNALHLAVNLSARTVNVLLSTSINYSDRQRQIPSSNIVNLILNVNRGFNLDIIKILVQAGVNLDQANVYGETPLFKVVHGSGKTNDLLTLEYLFLAGSTINSSWVQEHRALGCDVGDIYKYYTLLSGLFDRQINLSGFCRKTIRKCLIHTRDIPLHIEQLPLPSKLKVYLNECDQLE